MPTQSKTTKTPITIYRAEPLESRIASLILQFAGDPLLDTSTPREREYSAEALAITIINLVNKELI